MERHDYPFLIHKDDELRFSEIASQSPVDLSETRKGMWLPSLGTLILQYQHSELIDIGVVVVP